MVVSFSGQPYKSIRSAIEIYRGRFLAEESFAKLTDIKTVTNFYYQNEFVLKCLLLFHLMLKTHQLGLYGHMQMLNIFNNLLGMMMMKQCNLQKVDNSMVVLFEAKYLLRPLF